MLITIDNLLNAAGLQQVRRILDDAKFVPGTVSAGRRAARVKHNGELPLGAAELDDLNRIVMGALLHNPVYRAAALPLKVAAPYYARYCEGMYYGPHVDDPVMGEGPRYRSDVAVTVFLNSPAQYEGGALCIETEFGEQSIKLDAGCAVLYPASSLHRVDTVTAGLRLVAVTWVESMVRDAGRRALLYKLSQAREALLDDTPGVRAAELVDQVYVNLVRMWSTT